jgi:predicted tellurium resistance membrane protein TerC
VDWLTNPDIWIALITLTALEIVLGIDNIIFISILADKLPANRQAIARRVGLGLAMLMRILLLLSLSWVIRLTEPLFTVLNQEISGRDLILIGGGLFVLGKSTYEIHDKLEGVEGHGSARVKATLGAVLVQIVILDIVFSLDSVITAVGMVEELGVMIATVVIAVLVMMISAEAISSFVYRHPTWKMLALSFFAPCRVRIGAGGLRPARSQGLHLLCDGLLGVRGVLEHSDISAASPGAARGSALALRRARRREPGRACGESRAQGVSRELRGAAMWAPSQGP